MNQNNNPLFVVGVDRSGTTLLSLMLDAHSRIAIPYESNFFIRYFQDRELFEDLKDRSDRLALVKSILSTHYVRKWDWKITPEEVIDLDKCNNLQNTISQIYQAYAHSFGKDIWGDKSPSYTEHIYLLNDLFPSSRFIHIIRDGRDVALSIMQRWWGPNDFVNTIRYWNRTIICARKMLKMLPEERYIEVRFEDLVSDPTREIKRITDFIGVDFEEKMVRDYTKTAQQKVGERIHQHHIHLTKPPSSSQAFKWKKTLKPADQAIAYQIAGETLVELGYPEGVKSHPLKIFREVHHRLKESYVWRIRKWTRPKSLVDSTNEQKDDIFHILSEKKSRSEKNNSEPTKNHKRQA
jgi:LPS sulfotransferase NodH